jgi:hypothetical protein
MWRIHVGISVNDRGHATMIISSTLESDLD